MRELNAEQVQEVSGGSELTDFLALTSAGGALGGAFTSMGVAGGAAVGLAIGASFALGYGIGTLIYRYALK